ncbi:MAG: putative immunity protein [Trueperaceae bacterium]
MRDRRFVAVHRGGPLSKEHHCLLMRWACNCAKHVLPLLEDNIDERLTDALKTAKAWEKGKASVGDAQKAAWKAHTVARETSSPVKIAVARAVGHAVATAHMADHSLGPAYYALKAVEAAGKSTESERRWQDKQIPTEVQELVISALTLKFPKRYENG